jgi:hypothetical protein
MDFFYGIPNPGAWPKEVDYKDTFTDDAMGGRVVVRTPFEGLSFGGSYVHGEFRWAGEDLDLGNKNHYGVQVEYATERFEVRGEYNYLEFHEQDGEVTGAYVEGGVNLTDKLQAAVRYETSTLDTTMSLNPFYPLWPNTGEHDEWAFGVNYFIEPNLILRASYHMVEGNRFAYPATGVFNALKAQFAFGVPMEDRTDMLILGASFSF